MMLKAKESKGKGDRKSKKSTHVRFFLPSSPSSSSTLARGAANHDDSDDDIHALSPPPLSSSSSAARATSRSTFSHTPSSSHSSRSAPSSSSFGPPRRPPPSLPSSSSSSASSSSALPRRPPSSSSSSSSSFLSTPTADSLSSSSRVRLPPSSFSYLTPSALTSAPSLSSASSAPRRPPSSSTFFAPPPARSSFSFSSTAALSSSSSSTASLPGSSTGSADHGWDRYRSAVARAAAASSATPAATRPSPPPPQWRDDTDVSSSSAGSDEDESHDTIDATYSSATASPPPPSMSATEGEATSASAVSSGASSSSSTHSPVPSFSSSPVPGSSGAARSSSPTRAALPSPRRSSADPLSPEASVERAPASFACARPFDGVKDVNDVAAALEAWLVPPGSDQGTAKQKKTKIRFGVEVGRLSEPRCSLRVSHLTGAEGRKSRKWADVRRNTVALSFAFVVKEGVNVFELGELSGSIKNLLMLIGSDELDTDLESKLVDEGAGSSKILLLNLLFHDECLFRALSAVLGHHRIEQADASLLLSHAPADCRSRRARLESIDARLVVDAVISRSILRFAEELMINLRRETATASAPSSSAEQSGPASEERHRTGSDARTTKKRRRQTKQEQRRLAGALLRKYGQQLLGVPGLVGDDDGGAVTRLICLLRALNDIRFFVEFDSLDEFVRRLWRPTTPDSGPTPSAASRPRRSVSEEGELGAVKERKMKIKSRSKSKTQSKRRTKTETSETTDKTAKKKKKRLSTDSKRRSGSTSARESKRKSSDGARRRSKKSSSSRRRESRDDDPAVSYSWHSLHAYLLASYERLVRQTTAARLSDDESDDDKRDMGREIEEGLVASVRDMTLKLQSLSAIHSVRAIVGDDVLLVACEGMQVFEVLPSPEEMIAIERAAKRDAKKRHRRTVNNASTAAATKSEPSRTSAKRERTTGDVIEEDLSRSVATKAVPSSLASHPLPSPRREKVNIKLMVLGDLRVGKTSLIQRFMRGSAFALSKYKPTYAADFVHKNVVLLDKPRTLQIWDTSGNERQRAPDRAFFKGVDALVLVFDQRRASTFLPALDRHLDDFLAHAACPNPRLLPIVVIGNRCGEAPPSGGGGTESDGEGLEREVKRSEVEAWCRGRIEGNRLFAYFEVSAKEGTHVDDAFLHAANAVLDIHYGVI